MPGGTTSLDPGRDERIGARERDRLTGVGNRALLDRLALDTTQTGHLSVLIVDLDQFRAINDSYGHAIGDLVLREVAQRLSSVAGEGNLVARLASDEFAVVVTSRERSICQALACTVYDAIRVPLEVAGMTLFLDAGVGIALADGEQSLWQLVSRAGASIHDLKRSGRLPKIVLFDPATHGAILDTFALSLDLRAALTRDELVLHYQPIVEMATRRVMGFEALVRWSHPIRGTIPPLEFIPLVEDLGLMPEFGAWVLEEACREARSWSDQQEKPPFVTVNVSIRQLEDPDFTARFGLALAHSGCDPRQVKIEVTESVLASDVETVTPPLKALRAIGVGVLLDDFGTGYSSLGYVRELPLDGVKLDRIFTRDLTISAGAWTLARSVITLLSQLDLEIIAEGLETAAHLAQLRSLGCHVGQGYYFARPMPRGSLAFGEVSA
jgi:diguanylate cyclase (GGDEF)-like protein